MAGVVGRGAACGGRSRQSEDGQPRQTREWPSFWLTVERTNRTRSVRIGTRLAGALMIAVLAVGCSSGAASTPATTTAPTMPAATVSTIGATVQSAPPGTAGTVPLLTNEHLDLAEATLQSDHLGYKVYGGGVFGVVVASDWMVCSQSPPAGSTAGAVSLVVARSCS